MALGVGSFKIAFVRRVLQSARAWMEPTKIIAAGLREFGVGGGNVSWYMQPIIVCDMPGVR